MTHIRMEMSKEEEEILINLSTFVNRTEYYKF
jgi:hypothetical protein